MMTCVVKPILAFTHDLFKSRERLQTENTYLRHQLMVLRRKIGPCHLLDSTVSMMQFTQDWRRLDLTNGLFNLTLLQFLSDRVSKPILEKGM